jgi:hypothetical protein
LILEMLTASILPQRFAHRAAVKDNDSTRRQHGAANLTTVIGGTTGKLSLKHKNLIQMMLPPVISTSLVTWSG